MNLDEFKEFISNDENAQTAHEILKAAGYETPDDVQGLKNKNTQLLGNLQKFKKEKEELQKIVDSIDVNEYNELKSGKAAKPDQDLLKYQKQIEDRDNQLKQTTSQLHSVLKENALSKALDENGFDKKHLPILRDAFLGKARIENDQVVIPDTDGLEISVSEYFKKFAESDLGKSYLIQQENRGAGTRSFMGGGTSKIVSSSDFNKMRPKDRASFFANGGKIQN